MGGTPLKLRKLRLQKLTEIIEITEEDIASPDSNTDARRHHTTTAVDLDSHCACCVQRDEFTTYWAAITILLSSHQAEVQRILRVHSTQVGENCSIAKAACEALTCLRGEAQLLPGAGLSSVAEVLEQVKEVCAHILSICHPKEHDNLHQRATEYIAKLWQTQWQAAGAQQDRVEATLLHLLKELRQINDRRERSHQILQRIDPGNPRSPASDPASPFPHSAYSGRSLADELKCAEDNEEASLASALPSPTSVRLSGALHLPQSSPVNHAGQSSSNAQSQIGDSHNPRVQTERQPKAGIDHSSTTDTASTPSWPVRSDDSTPSLGGSKVEFRQSISRLGSKNPFRKKIEEELNSSPWWNQLPKDEDVQTIRTNVLFFRGSPRRPVSALLPRMTFAREDSEQIEAQETPLNQNSSNPGAGKVREGGTRKLTREERERELEKCGLAKGL